MAGRRDRGGIVGPMTAPNYVDPVDGTAYPIDVPRWRSDAGRPLLITPQPGIGPDDIDDSNPTLWRYRAALPVDIGDPIFLGEGRTPLLEVVWRSHGPHF